MHNVCNGYVQHACSCSCAGSIHAACEQLHTFCMHVFCTHQCLYVAYMWCVSIFVYAAHMKKMPNMCSMYAVYMPNMCSKVTGMYAACTCCMYSACMLYTCIIAMCSKVRVMYALFIQHVCCIHAYTCSKVCSTVVICMYASCTYTAKNNSQNNRFGSFNHIKMWFETTHFKAKQL